MSTYSLSGSGTHALTASTTGLQVTITTPSSVQGIGTANPVNHYHTGMLRFSDGTAYWDPVPITGGPQFIPVPQNATSFGYSLQGGAAVSITEVIGGTVFFSSPAASGSGLLASSVLVAPAATVTLTLAAGTYGDLVLSYDARSNDAANNAVLRLRFNNDAGSHYDDQWFYDNSTTTTVSPTASSGGSSGAIGFTTAANASANVSANGRIVVPNFQGTTFQKEYHAIGGMKDSNSTSRFFNIKAVGWWRDASAITSVTFLLDTGGSFIAGSAFRAWGM